jgi:hypothetical protein
MEPEENQELAAISRWQPYADGSERRYPGVDILAAEDCSIELCSHWAAYEVRFTRWGRRWFVCDLHHQSALWADGRALGAQLNTEARPAPPHHRGGVARWLRGWWPLSTTVVVAAILLTYGAPLTIGAIPPGLQLVAAVWPRRG